MGKEEFEKITSLEQQIVLAIAEIYNTSYHEVCDASEKNIYCIYANHMSVPLCKIHASTKEIKERVF